MIIEVSEFERIRPCYQTSGQPHPAEDSAGLPVMACGMQANSSTGPGNPAIPAVPTVRACL
jgi:hypothetical protein